MGGETDDCERICPRCRKARFSPQQESVHSYFPEEWLDTCTCSKRLPTQVLVDQVREVLSPEITNPVPHKPVATYNRRRRLP